jgi:hypothetical protein
LITACRSTVVIPEGTATTTRGFTQLRPSCDDAALQGPDRGDIARGLPEHVVRLETDTEPVEDHLVRAFVNRHDGRLVEDDSAIAGRHQRVGSTQIDPKIFSERESPEQPVHLGGECSHP